MFKVEYTDTGSGKLPNPAEQFAAAERACNKVSHHGIECAQMVLTEWVKPSIIKHYNVRVVAA
jgi:hypothetical protein